MTVRGSARLADALVVSSVRVPFSFPDHDHVGVTRPREFVRCENVRRTPRPRVNSTNREGAANVSLAQ